MKKPTPSTAALIALFLAPLGLLVYSLFRRTHLEPLFIHCTYFFLFAMVLVWAGVHIIAAKGHTRESLLAYAKDNAWGIAIAVGVSLIAWLAVDPALRVLADETNLLGTSKNLFFARKATFALSGKWYYDNFQELSMVIDRRPALFPFMVNLLHSMRGYSYRNPFLLNMLFLPLFVFAAYRLAKSLAGQTFGITAALLVAAHPITLMSIRSGGFDFFATAFALFILKNAYDHCKDPSAGRLALLWMNLCMFVEIRYESGLFFPPLVVLLAVFGLLRWEYIRPYRFIYALTPMYFLPRIWQAIFRGNVPEQDPGTVTFSLKNFITNFSDYFRPLANPFDLNLPHAALIILVGIVGCLLFFHWFFRKALPDTRPKAETRFWIIVFAWMACQFVILFTYYWGKPNHPAAGRLILAVDAFFSFSAAWAITVLLKRVRALVPVLVCAALFIMSVPAAAEGRFINQLTLIRQASAQWKFFEKIGDNRIMILTDRPGLFTVMNYGTMEISVAKQSTELLNELRRRLFNDIYIIQEVDLDTMRPKPDFDIWPDREKESLLEFQNDASSMIRISKVKRQ